MVRLGMAIAPDAVTCCRIRVRRGRSILQGAARVPLPAGTVTVRFGGLLITDEGTFAAGLTRALTQAGAHPGEIGLALPDRATRMGTLRFERLQRSQADMKELIRWRLKDLLPFRPAEARVEYQVLPRPSDGQQEVLWLLAHEPAVAQVEAVLVKAGLIPVSIVNRACALFHLWEAKGEAPGEHLLVWDEPETTTIVLIRDRMPRFWRVIPTPSANGDGEERAERAVAMVRETLEYLRETLGVEEAVTLWAAGEVASPGALATLAGAGVPVRALDVPGCSQETLVPTGAAVAASA